MPFDETLAPLEPLIHAELGGETEKERVRRMGEFVMEYLDGFPNEALMKESDGGSGSMCFTVGLFHMH
jgi:hypothetical protein